MNLEVFSVQQPLVLEDTRGLTSSLKENQKITVKVAAISGDRVVLNYGGKAIFAKSTVPLQVGSTLNVEVRQLRQEQITLSVLSSQSPSVPITAESSFEELLSLIRVKNTNFSKDLIKGMMETGIPINEGEVREAAALASQVGENPLTTKGLLFMLQNELPMTTPVLNRVLAFLGARENGSSPLGDLTAALHNFLAEVEAHNGGEIKTQLTALLENLEGMANISKDSLLKNVSMLIQSATTGTEAKLLAVAQSEMEFFGHLESLLENGEYSPALKDTLQVIEKEIAAFLKGKEDVPNLEEHILNRLNTLNSEDKSKFLQLFQNDPALKDLLKRAGELTTLHRNLADIINELNPKIAAVNSNINSLMQSQLPAPSLSSLSSALQQAVLHKDGEQLVNLGLSQEPEQPQVVVSIPINHLPGQPGGELRIYSRPGSSGKPINPRDVTLGFVLNTENMGKLSVLLTVKEEDINGHLSVERGELRPFLEDNLHILVDQLQSLSYKVKHLTVKVGEVSLPPIVAKNMELDGLTKIDIRV